jgi:thiamine biosynthesis lipoprotein
MPPLSRRAWLGWAAGLVVLPRAAQSTVRETRLLFGSPVELLTAERTSSAAREEAWLHLAELNARWNAWKPGELGELNAALRNGRAHRAPPALARMIRAAAPLEAASDGHFNPAIGGLVGAWGFHADVMRPGAKPDAALIDRWTAARPSLAQLDWRGDVVHSRSRALQLDFGAYAKGVAIEDTLDRLAQQGVTSALVNLGGNLAAMGEVDGRPWRVGIRDPHGPGFAATLDARGREAVVTSGTYERWRLLDDERCTHLLDPASGVPARGLDSVTVVHPSAAVADAAATALLVAGPGRWRAVAARMGVDQVLVIDRHGRRTATPRLAVRLQAARA